MPSDADCKDKFDNQQQIIKSFIKTFMKYWPVKLITQHNVYKLLVIPY